MSEENFSALFEESAQARDFREGAALPVEIADIRRDYVVVRTGLKSEGYIPVDEFKDDNGELEVQIGDTVDAEIELLDNGRGETVLSRSNIKRKRAWGELESAMTDEIAVDGTVRDRVKGGFTVMVNGMRAFLPSSLADVFPVKDLNTLIGQKMEFKVIKLEPRRSGIILSRRALIEKAMMGKSADGQDVLAGVQEGMVLKGIVRALAEYGAFVDVGGGIYGLLHVTDLAWRRIKTVNEVVDIGDTVEVKVLKVDREKARIGLGMKQLQEDPWLKLGEMYPPQSRLTGKVSNITDYGAFVQIEDGIEGLVHTSEMDWTRKNIHPSKLVQVGQEVEVMMLEIDRERRRISLGMKQCKDNPWQDFAAAYRKGSVLRVKIRTITDFGLFVELPGGIDGLIHMNDLSYKVQGEQALRQYSRGMEIEAVVISIDSDRERIGLGIKQLTDSTFNTYADEHLKNSKVQGRVIAVDDNGAEVELGPDVIGFLPISEMAESRITNPAEHIAVNEEKEFVLISVDRRSHHLTLSLKAIDRADREAVMRKHSRDSGAHGKTSLGAILGAHLGKKDDAKEEEFENPLAMDATDEENFSRD